jgi:hypothetical protein
MGRNRSAVSVSLWALCALSPGLAENPQAALARKLAARSLDSGFALAHTTFNGMLAASDGKVYYVLCSESVDTGAQMYSYDPATDQIRHLGDLTEASGEKGLKAIPQGKSHVNFVAICGTGAGIRSPWIGGNFWKNRSLYRRSCSPWRRRTWTMRIARCATWRRRCSLTSTGCSRFWNTRESNRPTM